MKQKGVNCCVKEGVRKTRREKENAPVGPERDRTNTQEDVIFSKKMGSVVGTGIKKEEKSGGKKKKNVAAKEGNVGWKAGGEVLNSQWTQCVKC